MRPREAALQKIFSFPAMLAFGLALVAVLTVSGRFDDPDLWWHLKLGEFVWNTHSVPHTDIFSFTAAGHAWTAHEWLAQLSLYTAYRLGGYSGVMLWLCALATAIFVGSYALCCLYSGNSRVAFLGGLVTWFFATVGLAPRPLILGHLLLVAELAILELGRARDRRWLWLLPPVFAVWVNCHGSYFFGMGVLAVHAGCSFVKGKWGPIVCEPQDKGGRALLCVVAALSAAALLLTPAGTGALIYPLDALFHQSTSMKAVQEWMPPELGEVRTLGMLALLASVMLLSARRGSRLRLEELLVLAAAAVMAFQHSRMLFLFGIIAAPIVCRLLRSDYQTAPQEHPVANAVLMLAALAVIWAGFPSPADLREQVRKNSPVDAVEHIRRAGLRGPMLNDYLFGGYLIWALPREKVFIDGRADVFDWTGVLDEYGRWATAQEDPSRLLDKYGIRLCIVSAGAPEAHVLPYLPGWRKAYQDRIAVVFIR